MRFEPLMKMALLCNARKLTLLFVSTLAAVGHASERLTYGDVGISELVSIYDADTITVNINQWPAIIGHRISIRVVGIDAPELKGKCQEEVRMARLAKQYVVKTLRAAGSIELRNVGRDKFFRIDAEVFADGKDLAEGLIANGLARPYDGGKRDGWCDSQGVPSNNEN